MLSNISTKIALCTETSRTWTFFWTATMLPNSVLYLFHIRFSFFSDFFFLFFFFFLNKVTMGGLRFLINPTKLIPLWGHCFSWYDFCLILFLPVAMSLPRLSVESRFFLLLSVVIVLVLVLIFCSAMMKKRTYGPLECFSTNCSVGNYRLKGKERRFCTYDFFFFLSFPSIIACSIFFFF
jgi:phosphoglycerol transferase MdoB-like AlkP superfamily enzyme